MAVQDLVYALFYMYAALIPGRYEKLYYMRRFIIFIALLLSVCMTAGAQDKTTSKQRIDQWKDYMKEFQQRQEPVREAARILDTLQWNQAGNSVAKRSFVIEADAVSDRHPFHDSGRAVRHHSALEPDIL